METQSAFGLRGSDAPSLFEPHCNWWDLVNRAQVINLGRFTQDYQSPMQPIDTWHHNRKLGMIVEARVLGGKLFMTTSDIDRDLENRPVARQMRKSILNYLNSDKFNPTMEVTPELISSLFTDETEPIKTYSNEKPDEFKPVLK